MSDLRQPVTYAPHSGPLVGPVGAPMPPPRVKPPSRAEVADAGRLIINASVDLARKVEAYTTINVWRWAHYVPMNAFYVRLKTNALKVSPNALTASRLKRFDAIEAKVRRFRDRRGFSIDKMQDIAGCRAVMDTVEQAEQLVRRFTHPRSKSASQLVKQSPYIAEPRDSGYRSHHLVYEYHGREERNTDYEAMPVELQIRSKLQHAWAAGVETVDLFTKQDLKSGGGLPEWKRLFALLGSFMAFTESRPSVPGTPTDFAVLRKELREIEASLNLLKNMAGWRVAIQRIPPGKAPWHLLVIDLRTEPTSVEVKPYYREESAKEGLSIAEEIVKGQKGVQVVLVRTGTVKATRLAYPAYFADTALFSLALSAAIR